MSDMLLTNQTANGSGSWHEITQDQADKDLDLTGYGTFDTCTITMEMSPDGGTNIITMTDEGADAAYTAEFHRKFKLRRGMYIRATVSSVGASTDVSVGID